jgi:SAM-dependent methyltransferase
LSKCPACGSLRVTLYLDGDDELSPDSVGSSRIKLSHGRILKCCDCGLAFRSHRPSPEELALLYRSASDQVYEAELLNRRRTAARHRQVVQRYRPEAGRILDVGCASGIFLKSMAEAGWKVFGVEPSSLQFDRARKLLGQHVQLSQCTLQEAKMPQVDVVTLWDVLEHVENPVGFMQLCASHLDSGGLLVLNVPRIDSPTARILGGRWPLLLAEHLNYFTKQSLARCGEQAGLSLTHAGSRPVSFSLGYIAYRLQQHGIPGASFAERTLSKVGLSRAAVPVRIGEMLAVMRRN